MNKQRRFQLRPQIILKAACVLSLTLGAIQAQEIKNGNFEGAFVPFVLPPNSKGKVEGSIAEGWRDETAWADVSIAYSKEPAGGHNGTSAQKIEVSKGTANFVQQLKLDAGTTYRVTAWVKAAAPGRAALALRYAGAPYTMYGKTPINLTTEWTKVEVIGTATASGNGLIMFVAEDIGTYWIDDVIFEATSAPKPVQAGVGAPALLKNGNFEGAFLPFVLPPNSKGKVEGSIAEGWRDETAWADVSIAYSKEPTGGHNGTSAQKIEVSKGTANFVQQLKLDAGTTYRVTAWAKAAAPGRAALALRYAGAPYTMYGKTPINLTTEWTKVEVIGTATASGNGLIMFVAEDPGTYWIDDVIFEATSAPKPVQAGVGAPALLKNGNFEGAFLPFVLPPNSKGKVEGSIAEGWRDETAWADVSIAYSKEPAGGHNGTSAQKIEVSKGTANFVQQLKLDAGTTYRVTAWAKAASPGRASLALRYAGAPYTMYGKTPINLTTEWTKVEVIGTATASGNGLIMFVAEDPGTYWIDDVIFEVASGPQSAVAPVKIKNGNFEGSFLPFVLPPNSKGKVEGSVAEGWRDESAWGEVHMAYSQDPTGGHNGTSAQKIEVFPGKGLPQFVQPFQFSAGRMYRVTAWVKAAAPGKGKLLLRQAGPPYAAYATTTLDFTTEWTKVVASATASKNENGLVVFIFEDAGSYWIDDVTLDDVTDIGKSGVQSPGGTVPVAVLNAGFEGQFHPFVKTPGQTARIEGELADGWKDDSLSDVSVVYGRDTTVANSGKAAQRIEVREINKGTVQFNQDIKLQKGHVYRFQAWLRSMVNAPAVLEVRQKGSPYRSYGRLNIGVTPEWQCFEVYARADEDIDGILNFNPSNPTVYWIDDVKFDDVTDSVGADGTVKEGNLFANGSFEAGMSEGWNWTVSRFDDNVKGATWEHLDLRPSIDTAVAADGKNSLTISLRPWSGGLFSSPVVLARFGQTYTASIAIKSNRPQSVNISLNGTSATQTVDVGPEWKRFSVSGAAVMGPTVQLQVRFVIRDDTAPVQFWVDGAMLEEGNTASPAYRAPFPAELALTMPCPGSIVFAGESAPLKLSTGGNLPDGAQLKWSVENLAGKVTELPPVTLPSDSLTIKPDALSPLGVFKIRAKIVDKAGKPVSGEIQKTFSRLPHPRDLTPEQVENSYFGCHVQLQPEMLAIAKATGHHWIRLHDTSSVTQWPNVEASPGVWVWNDEGIKAANEAGFKLVGLLAGAPNRVALHPQAKIGFFSTWNVPDAPGALDQWTEYVKQAVSHYKPMISYWEVWNEPYQNGSSSAFFPNGTPEQYAELMKRASVAIRESNPQANIVGICSGGGGGDWLDRVLKVVGPQYYDEMSFHAYGGRLQGGVKSQMADVTDNLNAIQARYGKAKPLWNSEGGPTDNISWYVSKTPAMHFQMDSIVRLDVAQIAAGVAKFFPYTMQVPNGIGTGSFCYMEYDHSLKPIVAARAVLASLIDGASYVNRTEPAPGIESHAFKQSDGSLVNVVWSLDSKPHAIDVPKRMHALDILGNPIKGQTVEVGEEPAYFVEK